MARPPTDDSFSLSGSGELLFVYGTLRRGLGHPLGLRLCREGRFLGEGSLLGQLYDLGQYPGAVRSHVKTEKVKGDLFFLSHPAEILRVLDEYEGVSGQAGGRSLFRRERCCVCLGPEKSLRCWVYLFNRPCVGFRRIASGDFLEDRRSSVGRTGRG